jgi:two-component system chemotaxis sensor kinase CheA
MRDKAGFVEYLEETREQVAEICEERISDSTVLKRVLHTLKGNSAIFGINSIAEQCHVMESAAEEQGAVGAAHRAELKRCFERLRGNVDAVLGERATRRVELDDEEYQGIVQAVLRNEGQRKLLRRIADWKLEPTTRRLQRIAEQGQRIASRLNKGPLEIRLSDGGLRLEPGRWVSFWAAFSHVLRNAVDHGIEQAEERQVCGKAQPPTLELITRTTAKSFIVEIVDNGRGVDWEAVRERAQAAGLPHASEKDLVEALFTDGISTARELSDLSGRGVGMGAVRAECRARGGQVQIRSRRGLGTTVAFEFPLNAMASDEASLAA